MIPSAVSAAARLAPARTVPDRIIVIGGSERTLDLLRIATVRSDDVVLFARDIDARTRRFVDTLAIECREAAPDGADLAEANAVLVGIGDVGRENAAVRTARRAGVPVHVADRPILSDFTLLELVERRASTFRSTRA